MYVCMYVYTYIYLHTYLTLTLTSKSLKVMGGVSLEHVALQGAETPKLGDGNLSTGCLILHEDEVTGLVQSREV